MTTREKWLRCLFVFLCGSGLSVGTLFCLITAHGITARNSYLIAACVISAAVYALIFTRKKPWGPALGLTAGILFFEMMRWRVCFGGALETVKAVLRHIGNEYPDLAEAAQSIRVPSGASVTAFLALLGCLLAALTVATLSRGWTLLPAVGLSAGLLATCFVMLYPVPAPWAVAMLITVYGGMALTAAARRRHAQNAEGKALLLIVPMALLGALLLVQVHPENYSYPQWSLRLEEKLDALSDRFPDLWDLTLGRVIGDDGRVGIVAFAPGDNTERADLANLNGGLSTDETVMTVRTTQEGMLYLRGCAYRSYTGRSWLGKGADDPPVLGDAAADYWTQGGMRSEIVVHTYGDGGLLYLPYGVEFLPERAVPVEDLYVQAGEGTTEYQLPYTGWIRFSENEPLSLTHNFSDVRDSYAPFLLDVYTELDLSEEAMARLQPILDRLHKLVPKMEDTVAYRTQMAQAVASYVRDIAPYSLETPQMPRGEGDFAAWFLTEGESGFCVHYATAVTVLLRAMGIPARYVSGYVVAAREDAWTVVAGRNAHAWVEYAAGDGRWTLLEATPGTEQRVEELSAYLVESTGEEAEEHPEDDKTDEEPDDPSEDDKTDDTSENDETDLQDELSEQGGTAARRRLPLWAKILLGIAAALVLWQIALRTIRERMLRHGDPNRRAVAYWKHISRLAKLSGTPVSQEIEDVALRARFSQHEITEDELRALEERASALREWMLAGGTLRSVFYRVIWAL